MYLCFGDATRRKILELVLIDKLGGTAEHYPLARCVTGDFLMTIKAKTKDQ